MIIVTKAIEVQNQSLGKFMTKMNIKMPALVAFRDAIEDWQYNTFVSISLSTFLLLSHGQILSLHCNLLLLASAISLSCASVQSSA